MKALFFPGRQFFDISMQKLILVFVSLIVHNQVVLRDQDAPRRVGHVLWTDPVPFKFMPHRNDLNGRFFVR